MTHKGLAFMLALAMISAPLVTEAEQAGKVARIGVLCLLACDGSGVDAFRLALRDLGYVEGPRTRIRVSGGPGESRSPAHSGE